MKYEYKVDVFMSDDRMRSGGSEERSYLKELGLEGWELTSVRISSLSFGSDSYYWKRQIKES